MNQRLSRMGNLNTKRDIKGLVIKSHSLPGKSVGDVPVSSVFFPKNLGVVKVVDLEVSLKRQRFVR